MWAYGRRLLPSRLAVFSGVNCLFFKFRSPLCSGRKNSRTMLLPLLQRFPEQVRVSLFHTPNLRGLLRLLIPERFNETIGLQHIKVYLFDNNVILSGWVGCRASGASPGYCPGWKLAEHREGTSVSSGLQECGHMSLVVILPPCLPRHHICCGYWEPTGCSEGSAGFLSTSRALATLLSLGVLSRVILAGIRVVFISPRA